MIEIPAEFMVTKTCGPDLLSEEWLETPVEYTVTKTENVINTGFFVFEIPC